MLQPQSYQIFNASAGSGKTFTLVKTYLKILFLSKYPLAFKTILALTFTNKAVAEMKERIIKMLITFSDTKILEHPNDMFLSLVDELSMNPNQLQQKSKLILDTIVHNYAAFDISTIDKFNHKLIRTFAHDLKLPLNFEVEIDTPAILAKAVDKLIDKAGTDEELTKILVDFAIEKADDDKSWDVSHDFNIVSKLLVNENDIPFIDNLANSTLSDFKKLKTNLSQKTQQTERQIIEKAQQVLELITNYGLQFDDFSSSYIPKYFLKLVDGNFEVSFTPKWQTDLIDGNPLYPKRVSAETASTIDAIQPQITEAFTSTKQNILHYKFLKNALKNSTPLSVLSAINQSLKELKEEDDLLLISEFNAIINNEIKAQPTPFIYERIGEKFKHYFIDEFQDTSVLQWENLVPLVDNALSGENLKGETGSTLLVGDAKQAIYRWRGGRAEQFIDLYSHKKNPFQVKATVKNLPANYRSTQSVVQFNNSFFQHISQFAFSNPEHQAIYEASKQDLILKAEGYVELSFLELEEEDDKTELYCQKVLETIHKVLTHGFELSDICIITRKTKEGVAIAEYLSNQNIPIVSSETLLLKHSPEIQFMSAIVALTTQMDNELLKIEILSYLAEHQLQLEDKHSFFESLVHLSTYQVFEKLNDFGFSFSWYQFLQMSLYEAIESIVRGFKLNKTSNAYIQFYLDSVLDYSQKNNANFTGFIAYWDLKKDSTSIVSPKGNNALQIMTIHKSKGLEFPVVIFPFANQDIYFDRNPKTWIAVDKNEFNGFSNLYVNLNKDLEDFGTLGAEIYRNHQAELELDSLNLLYVALTRAVEQLYIISEYDVDKAQNEKLKLYSGLFINYLKSAKQWNEHQKTYNFGNPEKRLSETKKETTITQAQFISVSREDHHLKIVTNAAYLWDTEQEKAIEKGNLVHLIMSQITTENDIDYVFEQFLDSGKINPEQSNHLKPLVTALVNHKILKPYFNSDMTIYNEKDIISKHGLILRPDRIAISTSNEAVIIDYKTGLEAIKHQQQLQTYQDVLEDMGFKVTKKILIYINDGIQIKEF
ncbi:MAG: UvrD-helicase domain-containing protein [Gelidibacter sp.]|nr:UvrD-helicase domain-containing protein [Gelidibacter sp.]